MQDFYDKSQRDRILRYPTTGLFFVHTKTKGRMVVYLDNKGKHIYDLVPDAQLDEGVNNEGQWPRYVDFCR